MRDELENINSKKSWISEINSEISVIENEISKLTEKRTNLKNLARGCKVSIRNSAKKLANPLYQI